MMRESYQPCVSDKPLERENGYNIKVNIQSKDGTLMKDLGFDCEFWIEGSGRRVVIGKADMADITQLGKATEYYAQMYSSEFGGTRGWLFCTIAIQQPDKNWPSGYRDVTIEKVFTGIYLGQCCGRMPRAPRNVCYGNQWHDGFKVSFAKVDWLPKGVNDEDDDDGSGNIPPLEGETIYYGVVRGVKSFSSLSDEQLSSLKELPSIPSGGLEVPVTVGDTLVVLTGGTKVMKDDGVGGEVPFDTSVMGANGDIVRYNGANYNVYGETFIVSGTIVIHFLKK